MEIEWVEWLENLVADITELSNASEFHYAVELALINAGCNTMREFWVIDRGDYYHGRIDLIAYNKKLSIVIELDNKSPREKSVYKLKYSGVPGLLGFVILRTNPPQVISVEDI